MKIVKSIALLSALSFQSCATQEKCPSQGPFYKSEIPMSIDGVDMSGGVYVVDKRPAHDIRALIPPDTEQLLVSSCDQFLTWKKPSIKVEFKYKSSMPFTDEEICPVEASAFSRGGMHSWAYIDFRTTENLYASLTCDDSPTKEVFGVSACRAEVNTKQIIEFKEQVSWVFSEGCPEPKTDDSKRFVLTSDNKKCFYLFENDEGFHRATVIGFRS